MLGNSTGWYSWKTLPQKKTKMMGKNKLINLLYNTNQLTKRERNYRAQIKVNAGTQGGREHIMP